MMDSVAESECRSEGAMLDVDLQRCEAWHMLVPQEAVQFTLQAGLACCVHFQQAGAPAMQCSRWHQPGGQERGAHGKEGMCNCTHLVEDGGIFEDELVGSDDDLRQCSPG